MVDLQLCGRRKGAGSEMEDGGLRAVKKWK
jgi:hypothetical protein